ncbi:MAG: LPS assembly lipoprotein LptE [Chthoniobacterales bacterium]
MRLRHLAILIVLSFPSCGYQLGEIKPTPMRAVHTLAIPTFVNKTYETRVEVLVADTVIKQFQQDGTYPIVSESKADAILYGTITRLERRSIRSVLSNVLATSEFDLHMEVEYKVVDRTTGRILMRARAVGNTPFFTSPDLQTDERQAIPLAAQRMAVQIVSDLAEGW